MSEPTVCPDCKGAGVKRIEITGAINEEPCKTCSPSLQTCANGHTHIVFTAHACPLCAALARIALMDKALRSWRVSVLSSRNLPTDAIDGEKPKVTIAEEGATTK